MAASLFGRRVGRKSAGAVIRPQAQVGSWTLTVTPDGLPPISLAVFRGIPTQLAGMEFEDPFGPVSFSFTLPAVSLFDRIGYGDLSWCQREANVDLVHVGSMPAGYPFSGFRWEGYVGNFDWSDNGFTLQCIGAMHQIDLEKAKPTYPYQPIPYELMIARCFTGRSYLRTKPMRIEWPSWWKTKYAAPVKGTPGYMIPLWVTAGQNWTGLLTRNTGQWDDMLTGYIQSLLVSMYTERGRWTIDLDPGRVPVLRHRDMRFESSDSDVVIDVAQPGIKPQLAEDWTQSMNVLYGSGQSLSGVGYSGMEVSSDGSSTLYTPLAAARQVEPSTDRNGWYQRSRFRREVVLQLQPGLDEIDARKMASAHLARFGDPGITGSITMQTDPILGGQTIPRHLVRAGMTVRLPKVFGSPEGPLLHVAKSSHDFGSQTSTITVDSKYRDALTVDEVKLRGRDALSISRLLVTGGYQPPVPDQLLPWNYAGGSGFIPSSPQLSSLRLFKGMPAGTKFPWTDWTTSHPPKSAAWKSCYIRIGPASVNADNNWSGYSDKAGSRLGIPVKMAQAGQIRLLQLAAYDRDGNVLPVDFHFGLYYSHGVNYGSMPSMPVVGDDGVNNETRFAPYKGNQRYPFFPAAFESYNANGTAANPKTANAVATSGPIRLYGGSYEKAGHWPGSSASNDPATGLLVDESKWDFDCTHFDASFNMYSATRNLTNALAGVIYAMIWCDQQRSQEVYFLGRIYRTEPGTST